MFRLFECCALSFFERFVLSFSLKIERFVSDSAEIWICGLYKMDVSFITKRYFIRGFNKCADRIGEEKAFMALDKLKYMELTDEKLKQVKDEADFKIMLDEALKA